MQMNNHHSKLVPNSFIRAVFSILCLVFIRNINGEILQVPSDYSTPQEAIDASEPGDTVLLADGEYTDRYVISEHGITFCSEYLLNQDTSHITNTRLYSTIPGRSLVIEHEVSTPVRIVGLTFEKVNPSNSTYFGGVAATNVEIEVSFCRFENCLQYTGGGLQIDSCEAIISNNVFINNTAGNFGGGLSCKRSNGFIRNNHFISNRSTFGGGAGISGDMDDMNFYCHIFENLFHSNEARNGAGIQTAWIDSIVIRSNYFTLNYSHDMSGEEIIGHGSALDMERGTTKGYVINNTFRANRASWQGGAIFCLSPALIRRNCFIENSARVTSVLAARPETGYDPFTLYFTENIIISSEPMDRGYTEYYGAFNVYPTATLVLESNDFYHNEWYAVNEYRVSHGEIIAHDNFWGDPSGPYHPDQNPFGLGDTVASEIDVDPWATEPFTGYRPPFAFDLVSPENGAVQEDTDVEFVWRSTTDPNEGDSIRSYCLELSTDFGFNNSQRFYTSSDTTFTVNGLLLDSCYFWRVVAKDTLGLRQISNQTWSLWITESPEFDTEHIPTQWAISGVYPNPFNSSVHLTVDVPQSSTIQVEVLDLTGRRIALLHRGAVPAGTIPFRWSSTHPSGIYFIRVSSDSGWSSTRKVVLLR